MRVLRGVLLVLCLGLFSVAAFADSVTANFNIDRNMNPIASQGSVTFTLNGDGTIAASVTITNGLEMIGFAYNSKAIDLPESNFSPITNVGPLGWYTDFGLLGSGFGCLPNYGCSGITSTETFTIGNPGDYTSVFQVLDGGSNATVDFVLADTAYPDWDFGARATPEPGSLALLGSGVLAVAGVIRRKFMV